jgi:hypothetical protein
MLLSLGCVMAAIAGEMRRRASNYLLQQPGLNVEIKIRARSFPQRARSPSEAKRAVTTFTENLAKAVLLPKGQMSPLWLCDPPQRSGNRWGFLFIHWRWRSRKKFNISKGVNL